MPKTRYKHFLGRPKKYSNVEEFEVKCSEYFLKCIKDKEPMGICGLAAYLDIDRTTLYNYEKNYPDSYGLVIKQAKAKIEAFLEAGLYKNKQVTGIIFNLKNNFGYAEREKVENINVDMSYEEYIKKMESCTSDEEY
ncbi:MAG: hypothetical protein J6K45_04325 [Clostridia bacterium]|nr:hypothetical protein [Clostridia bacterium]